MRALLAAALLLPASFQVCLAVTVPGTVAETGALLSGSGDAPQMPGGAVADIHGRGMQGVLQEAGSGVSLDRQQPGGQRPAVAEGETDARLFLFALLGFAAIAAGLSELLGRKQ